MASIVSSVITLQNVQSDGRIVVIENHTDDSGNPYQISYMAAAGSDLNAHLAADATNLTAELQAAAQQQAGV